jgi:tRNA modification GTPase
MLSLDDTIVAVASPPGGAARGIVRLSGPRARECVESRLRAADRRNLPSTAAPTARHGELSLPDLPSSLPAEVFFWPGSRSYTRQPVVEIHTIGSPPLLQSLLRALCDAGARPAGPGEFTLRAFLSGRIDLTQAEAVLGVIDAAGAGELKVALSQLAGGLATPLHRLRGALLDLLAELEAGLDFTDEDITFITRDELNRQLADAEASAAAIVQQMAARGAAGGSVRAVLVGRPNTGKSSLFNAIAGRAHAIVSDHPGTTRDYLLATLDFDGVRCELIDTAGMVPAGGRSVPESDTSSESTAACNTNDAAQSAAADQRSTAHVQLLCLDSTRPLDPWEQSEVDRTVGWRIIVLTKCDALRRCDCSYPALETSSRSGDGITALRAELRRAVLATSGQPGNVVAATAVRCSSSLHLARECLQRARSIAASGSEELVAAEVREALTELGKVVGDVHTEDVLERIFSRFCVGK